jgi:hypothetical protein
MRSRPLGLHSPVTMFLGHQSAEDSDASQPPASRADGYVAEYIADMAAELAVLANGARLETLAYLLHLAHIEAASHVPKLS